MTLYFKGSNGNMREIAQISDSLSTEEAALKRSNISRSFATITIFIFIMYECGIQK